jgi:hypothetical protein
MSRSAHIQAFLKAAGWDMAQRGPLAGDAGNRKYERLNHPQKGAAILMDADPATGEDIRPFLNIAAHLNSCDLSAPEIYNADCDLGLILLEDFGDQLLFDVANTTPELEYPLYKMCLKALTQLHQTPPPLNVESYFPHEMAQAAEITSGVVLQPGPRSDHRSRTASNNWAISTGRVPFSSCAITMLKMSSIVPSNLVWPKLGSWTFKTPSLATRSMTPLPSFTMPAAA